MSTNTSRNLFYREDGSIAWGAVAVVVVGVLMLLVAGYFIWFLPAQTAQQPAVIINNPATPHTPGVPGTTDVPAPLLPPGTLGVSNTTATTDTPTTAPGLAGAPEGTGDNTNAPK